MRSSGDSSARASGQQARALFCWIVLACIVAPRDVDAYELRQTSNGSFVRWESDQVPFVVDASVDAAAPGGVGAAVQAIAAWSGAGSGPELTARLSEGATGPAVDGRNTILYMPDGYPPAEGALAVTISTVDVSTGELLDTDIVINGRYTFAVLAQGARPTAGAQPVAMEGEAEVTDAPSGPFDLQHVVAHEMGHALGLADVGNDPGAAMYAYTSAGDASRRGPSPDDVAGLDSLYDGLRWSGSCSTSRVPLGRPGIDGALAWSSLGAAVMLLRRRRGAWHPRRVAAPRHAHRNERPAGAARARHDCSSLNQSR